MAEKLQALVRRFAVEASLDEAWRELADVEGWPSWAPHIRKVRVDPAGPLGPESRGRLTLRGGLRSTFRMATWEPQRRWTWVGPLAWLRVHYDHRFEREPSGGTNLIWTVSLSGPGASVVRGAFSRAYGRNVDRAIPQLQRKLARQV